MYRYLIFDADHTLIDFDADERRAFARAFLQAGRIFRLQNRRMSFMMIARESVAVKGGRRMEESFWYTVASVMAGVGTGLVGLSAATATAASLVSARFANRVDNRTVGLVTGAILTSMGAALILLFLNR